MSEGTTVTRSRQAVRDQLYSLYSPKGVAIIGASSEPNSVGGRALNVLVDRGFAGRIYPVNPRHAKIAGVDCYPSFSAVREPVDVVEVLIAPRATPEVVRECANRGVRAVILLNAGFAELSIEGAELQREVNAIARDSGMRILGPNCGGIMDVPKDIALGFLPAFGLTNYRAGHLAVVAQSGGVLTNLLNKFHDRGVGMSFAASTGNEADLSWLDFLDFVVHDESTKAVAIYAESMPDANLFLRISQEALTLGKPLVMLKGGMSHSGQEAATSHTAALATSRRVLEAVARQRCITLVDEIDDLVDISAYLAFDKRSSIATSVVLTTSGGMAVMTADACDDEGVSLDQFSDETSARLAEVLPSFAIIRNPLDITAHYLNDASLFRKTLDVLSKAQDVSAILLSLAMITEGYAQRFADEILDVSRSMGKPVTVNWVGGSLAEGGVRRLYAAGYPVFRRLRTCMHAIRASADFSRASFQSGTSPLKPETISTVSAGHVIMPPLGFNEFELELLLKDWGLPVIPGALVSSPEEAVAAAANLGFPVVAKISSSRVGHKSDVGGVHLDLRDAASVRSAFLAIREVAERTGMHDQHVLVQKMAAKGIEMIVGLQRDPDYGWLVLAGFGGIHAEVLQDVAIRVAPVTGPEAFEMLRELRGYNMLEAFRGRPPADVGALAQLIAQVSLLTEVFGDQVGQLDLNPVIVSSSGNGVCCVDALLLPATAQTHSV